MQWIRRGLIFQPDHRYEWMQTHAQLPTADPIGGDMYRIYFASRDTSQRSSIGSIEIDIHEPFRLRSVSEKPLLEPGPIGCFDEHGVYPSSIVNHGGDKYLYYVGWTRGAEPPLFYASVGLAISRDGGKTFSKYSKAPIMARSEYDPCLVTSPFAYMEDGKWKMVYVSGFKWERIQQSLRSFYHIKYAESDDGKRWRRAGRVAIDFKSNTETNIARPVILKEKDLCKMWYCYAGERSYAIGYAESQDGLTWRRKDEEAGMGVSGSGFDSGMVCYPYVVSHGKKKYMFYNGNSFGRDGIGLAVAEA